MITMKIQIDTLLATANAAVVASNHCLGSYRIDCVDAAYDAASKAANLAGIEHDGICLYDYLTMGFAAPDAIASAAYDWQAARRLLCATIDTPAA